VRLVPSDPAVDGAPLPRGAGRHAADALLGRAHALLPHGEGPPGRLLPRGRNHPRDGAERRGRALPCPRRHGQPRGGVGVGGGHGRPPPAGSVGRSGAGLDGEGVGRGVAQRSVTGDRLGGGGDVVVGFEMGGGGRHRLAWNRGRQGRVEPSGPAQAQGNPRMRH
jgi:hypothetical protein